MEDRESSLILPLGLAESRFLQVLLTRFSLKQEGNGILLEVEFDDSTPTVRNHLGKKEVRRRIGARFDEKRSVYQAELDRRLLTKQGLPYAFEDEEFPFRYASGGALPVLKIDGHEYYCLFYREVFPIGWNIANGGCDTRDELINPTVTIDRELREELLVINPRMKKRYVFEEDAGKPMDWPEFAVARRILREYLGENLDDYGEIRIPLTWLEGPDSLSVRFQQGQARFRESRSRGFFLNVNAHDFGIEFDKIAYIPLDPDDVLIDGEIAQWHPINCPVGLFRVDRVDESSIESRTEFFPDIIFYNGKRRRESIQQIVEEEFMPYLRKLDPPIRTSDDEKEWKTAREKYNLCPVTKNIMRRHLIHRREKVLPAPGPVDIFICHSGEDRNLANMLKNYLVGKRWNVFFSEMNLQSNFPEAIMQALESARALIVVGTQPKHLLKEYPRFEYIAFHHSMLFKKKPENAQLLTLRAGFPHEELPLPLLIFDSVACNLSEPGQAFEEIEKRLRILLPN